MIIFSEYHRTPPLFQLPHMSRARTMNTERPQKRNGPQRHSSTHLPLEVHDATSNSYVLPQSFLDFDNNKEGATYISVSVVSSKSSNSNDDTNMSDEHTREDQEVVSTTATSKKKNTNHKEKEAKVITQVWRMILSFLFHLAS